MEKPSSILYRNDDGTVILLDIPSSLEEAQVLPGIGTGSSFHRMRILSGRAPDEPFSTPHLEFSQTASTPAAQVAELTLAAAANDALDVIRRLYAGPWCLPRLMQARPHIPHQYDDAMEITSPASVVVAPTATTSLTAKQQQQQEMEPGSRVFTPPQSHYIIGSIRQTRQTFLKAAPPTLNLILLDPPWPNRSAKRKKGGYSPAASLDAIRDLLSHIPVAARLADDGLVAIWITNAARVYELLTSPRGGIFAEWGVELVGEWTWVKVTTCGEPVVDVESTWRKPWERLLIARKIGCQIPIPPAVAAPRVIVAVPDHHSRKPSLRALFDEIWLRGYEAVEVFARNLTAGWWAWGDEVLCFQGLEHWVGKDQ